MQRLVTCIHGRAPIQLRNPGNSPVGTTAVKRCSIHPSHIQPPCPFLRQTLPISQSPTMSTSTSLQVSDSPASAHPHRPILEDSFILLDALELDAHDLRRMHPSVCVEIGSAVSTLSVVQRRAPRLWLTSLACISKELVPASSPRSCPIYSATETAVRISHVTCIL